MSAFATIAQLTAQKINILNAGIEALEAELFQKNMNEQNAYTAAGKNKRTLFSKWLYQFRKPKIVLPKWQEDQSRIEIQTLLVSSDLSAQKLAPLLNLYVLNAAIQLARLNADRKLVYEAEELRILAERLSSVGRQEIN